MKFLLSLLCLSTLVFASEAMSERMQSVVDEVRELRENYEDISRKYNTCKVDLEKQKKEMNKLFHHEGFDYEAFEKNREKLTNLETEYKEYENLCEKSQLEKSRWIESLKIDLQTAEEKNRTLKETNDKLVKQNSLSERTQIVTEDTVTLKMVKEKNKTLENKLSLSQKELVSLQKELLSLRDELDTLKENRQTKIKQNTEVRVVKEIKTKKVYVSGCKDDNPFPKLMMKEAKNITPLKVEPKTVVIEEETEGVIEDNTTKVSHTYRMRVEAKIYNGMNGDFIESWEEKTSFTSNLTQDGWIMITGYFINKKWVKAMEKRFGMTPGGLANNSYCITSSILAGLKATGGDETFSKLWPAVTGVKMDTPQGPLSYTPEGVALVNGYIVEAKKEGERYFWDPIKVYPSVRDPRLK